MSLQWGAWAEVGMAARGAAAERMAAMETASGFGRLGLAQGLGALHAAVGEPLEATERAGWRTVEPRACAEAIDTLLLKPMSYDTVRTLGDAACIDAVRALTLRVCAASDQHDPAEARRAQKRLGTALLRWMLLREDGLAAAADGELT